MSRREISLPSRSMKADSKAGQIPCVVIVGRPNVGKSSLLNCLARQRIAIVDPMAGVTRDRISAYVVHAGRQFELWDTGGIGTPDDFAIEVEGQIEAALARADVVLFVVDAQAGLLPLDEEIGRRLRRIERPVLLVANKVDHASHAEAALEFHRLGFGEPLKVCALHSQGRHDLLEQLVRTLPERHEAIPNPVMRIAIVGRQNVGKSTLVNTLAREERMIVSETPGTTRDAVDVRFEREGRVFVAVDTAGLKQRKQVTDSVEFYSLVRAYRAIRRCDVVLHMIDLGSEISRLDKQLASVVEREAKPCVLTVNKWDLNRNRTTTEAYVKYLNDHMTGLSYAPVSFISAREGLNVNATLELVQTLFQQGRTQVSTGRLNAVLRKATDAQAPEVRHGKQPRLFYATQISAGPPTFLIFAAYPQFVTRQYVRYLANCFRERLGLQEIPVRILFRSRPRGRKEDETPG